jgi:protoheme IX farnesyltransferase
MDTFACSFSGSFRISGPLPGLHIRITRAAGFKLLPSGEGQTKYSALQAVIYSLLLLPVGILPYFNGMSGLVSLVIILVANIFMIGTCVRLYKEMTVQAARRVMFSSYIYLPVVLLALLIDKVAN